MTTVARPVAPGDAAMNQPRKFVARYGVKSTVAPTPLRITKRVGSIGRSLGRRSRTRSSLEPLPVDSVLSVSVARCGRSLTVTFAAIARQPAFHGNTLAVASTVAVAPVPSSLTVPCPALNCASPSMNIIRSVPSAGSVKFAIALTPLSMKKRRLDWSAAGSGTLTIT